MKPFFTSRTLLRILAGVGVVIAVVGIVLFASRAYDREQRFLGRVRELHSEHIVAVDIHAFYEGRWQRDITVKGEEGIGDLTTALASMEQNEYMGINFTRDYRITVQIDRQPDFTFRIEVEDKDDDPQMRITPEVGGWPVGIRNMQFVGWLRANSMLVRRSKGNGI
jgi:hypothetical protein